jgi:hypothetical protein
LAPGLSVEDGSITKMNRRLAFLALAVCLTKVIGCGATEPLDDDDRRDSGADAVARAPDDPVTADAGFDGAGRAEKDDAGAANDSGSAADSQNPSDSGSGTDSENPADAGSRADSESSTDSGTIADAGVIDAEAAPDAGDSFARFDVVYIDEFTTAWNRTGLLGFLAIVNTGRKPLDLATLSIVTYLDDSPELDSSFEQVVQSTNYLPPNHIAGVVSTNATAFLQERGFLTEPFIDDDTLVGITFHEHAAPGTDLHALATLRIEDAEVVLPFTVHFVPEQMTRVDHASRVSSR